jgi:hypothetical protein
MSVEKSQYNSQAKPLLQIERHSYSEVGWISRQTLLALRSRENFFIDVPFYRIHDLRLGARSRAVVAQCTSETLHQGL